MTRVETLGSVVVLVPVAVIAYGLVVVPFQSAYALAVRAARARGPRPDASASPTVAV